MHLKSAWWSASFYCVPPSRPRPTMWSFPCVFDRSGKGNNTPAALAARSPSCKRFSSIANAANVQLSTLKGERRRRTGNISLWSKSEMQSEALSSKSLGTTHCCHYIRLHYIHQPLHLWSCRRAQKPVAQSVCCCEKRLFSWEVQLFPPNPASHFCTEDNLSATELNWICLKPGWGFLFA